LYNIETRFLRNVEITNVRHNEILMPGSLFKPKDWDRRNVFTQRNVKPANTEEDIELIVDNIKATDAKPEGIDDEANLGANEVTKETTGIDSEETLDPTDERSLVEASGRIANGKDANQRGLHFY